MTPEEQINKTLEQIDQTILIMNESLDLIEDNIKSIKAMLKDKLVRIEPMSTPESVAEADKKEIK